MTDPTPAARLRAAAQVILDTAAKVGEPWYGLGDLANYDHISESDAAWIVLLDPDNAEDLAEWLNTTAHWLATDNPAWMSPTETVALAFADGILGKTT